MWARFCLLYPAYWCMGPDPLTDLLARALAVPLRELYAVLVRAGVVQILDEESRDEAREATTVA
jgi:hypothetical protein